MISPPPSDWKDLQRKVSEIFRRSGLRSETNKKITTTRGTVSIDVYAEDSNQNMGIISRISSADLFKSVGLAYSTKLVTTM